MHKKDFIIKGKELSKESRVLIMIHGRGGSAEDILSLANHLNVNDYTLIAPRATNNSWYPNSFLAPVALNEPWLSSALEAIQAIVDDVIASGVTYKNIYFAGFSQGACLTLEYTARNAKQYGGIAAFTGGLIGDTLNESNYSGNFEDTPVFIGTSDPDPHVPVERVKESTNILKNLNAGVTEKIYPGMGHTINEDELRLVNHLIFKD